MRFHSMQTMGVVLEVGPRPRGHPEDKNGGVGLGLEAIWPLLWP